MNPNYRSLNQEERDEIFTDRCTAYNEGIISVDDFRRELAELGYNATEIEEHVRFYAPPPPENDNGFEGE